MLKYAGWKGGKTGETPEPGEIPFESGGKQNEKENGKGNENENEKGNENERIDYQVIEINIF